MLTENKELFVCYVDFTKACDYLVRENIFYKLIQYGIRGKILNIIKSLYSNIKSRVNFNNTLSEAFECHLGVCQGDLSSPLIFSLYVNDLEDYVVLNGCKGIDIGIVKLFLLLYANDIVIFAETEQRLREGLYVVSMYCKKWKLVVNVNKTKVVVFRILGRLKSETDVLVFVFYSTTFLL